MIAAVVVAVARNFKRFEGQAPEIVLDHDFKTAGRTLALTAAVRDAGTGLKQVSIRFKQGEQEAVLADESLDRVGEKTYDIGQLVREKFKLQEGAASLKIAATDSSIRHFCTVIKRSSRRTLLSIRSLRHWRFSKASITSTRVVPSV
jgi:hypothetical protein